MSRKKTLTIFGAVLLASCGQPAEVAIPLLEAPDDKAPLDRSLDVKVSSPTVAFGAGVHFGQQHGSSIAQTSVVVKNDSDVTISWLDFKVVARDPDNGDQYLYFEPSDQVSIAPGRFADLVIDTYEWRKNITNSPTKIQLKNAEYSIAVMSAMAGGKEYPTEHGFVEANRIDPPYGSNSQIELLKPSK